MSDAANAYRVWMRKTRTWDLEATAKHHRLVEAVIADHDRYRAALEKVIDMAPYSPAAEVAAEALGREEPV